MLMRTDPFRDLDRLAQQLLGTNARPSAMLMDAWRDGDRFVVEFDLPGVSPDSVDLDVERNVLTVTAQRPPLPLLVPGVPPALAAALESGLHEDRRLRPSAAELASAGGSGLITPDLVPDEAAEWVAAADAHDLDKIFLIAPSSTDRRLAMTVEACRGFVYATAVMGVTGARESTSDLAGPLVKRARELTDLPIAVGLGVSNGDQAAEVAGYADGVIVGSEAFTPDRTIDARGALVVPGLVDLAARLGEPGHEHAGLLESELAAAVAGESSMPSDLSFSKRARSGNRAASAPRRTPCMSVSITPGASETIFAPSGRDASSSATAREKW